MVLLIQPNGNNDYDSQLQSGNRVNVEQINYNGGDNSQSVSKNLIRYMQDWGELTSITKKINGFQLTPNEANTQHIDVSTGHALIRGRWIHNDATIIYEPNVVDSQEYFLILRLTDSTSITRNPETDQIALSHEVVSTYTTDSNELILGLFQVPDDDEEEIDIDLVTDPNDTVVDSIRSVDSSLPIKITTSDHKSLDIFEATTWDGTTETHIDGVIKLRGKSGISIDDNIIIWRQLGSSKINMRIDDFSYANHTHRPTYAGENQTDYRSTGGALYLSSGKIMIGSYNSAMLNQALGQTVTGDVNLTSTGKTTLNLADDHIYIGEATGLAVGKPMTGDVSIDSTGATTVVGYSDLKDLVDGIGNIWRSATNKNSGRHLTTFLKVHSEVIEYQPYYNSGFDPVDYKFYDLVFLDDSPPLGTTTGTLTVSFKIDLPPRIGSQYLTIQNIIFHAVGNNVHGTNSTIPLSVKIFGIRVEGGSNSYNSYSSLDEKTVTLENGSLASFRNPRYYTRRHNINYVTSFFNPNGIKLDNVSSFEGFVIEVSLDYQIVGGGNTSFRITPPNIIYHYT